MVKRDVYWSRRESGKCTNCGGVLDGDGVKCTACAHREQIGTVGRKLMRDGGKMDINTLLLEDKEKALEVAAKRDMTKALRERNTFDMIRTAIIASLAEVDFSDMDNPLNYESSDGGKPETQGAVLSDVHYGRKSRDFNTAVCRERLGYYLSRVVRIADLHRNAYPVDTLVVFALGDMIDNEVLFPTQPHEIEIPAFQQVVELAQVTTEHLVSLAENYQAIEFYGVPGNHGRVSYYHNPVTNWDNLYYAMVQAMVKSHPRIYVSVPQDLHEWYNIVEVRKHNFLITHGDTVRAWLNIPWYGLIQAGMRWQGSMKQPWEYLIHGHFHSLNMGAHWNNFEILSNGTLLSDDTYSLQTVKLQGDLAQITFGVSERYGISWRYGIRIP